MEGVPCGLAGGHMGGSGPGQGGGNSAAPAIAAHCRWWAQVGGEGGGAAEVLAVQPCAVGEGRGGGGHPRPCTDPGTPPPGGAGEGAQGS